MRKKKTALKRGIRTKAGFRTPRKFIALKVKAIKKWKARSQPKLKRQWPCR